MIKYILDKLSSIWGDKIDRKEIDAVDMNFDIIKYENSKGWSKDIYSDKHKNIVKKLKQNM